MRTHLSKEGADTEEEKVCRHFSRYSASHTRRDSLRTSRCELWTSGIWEGKATEKSRRTTDGSSHDVEEPSGSGQRRPEGSEGEGEGPQELGVKPALWKPWKSQTTQPLLPWQCHQDHQIHPPPLYPHEPLWAVSPSGQHLLRGPGYPKLCAPSERLRAHGSYDPNPDHHVSDSPERRMGGLQEVPVRQEAQQHAVPHLQQVTERQPPMWIQCVVLFLHDVANRNTHEALTTPPHLCLGLLSIVLHAGVLLRECVDPCECVFYLLCVSAPRGNFWLRNRKCVGDHSSFEEPDNNISQHRIVHIWWNAHLGVASAETVRLAVIYFWKKLRKMNNSQRRINTVTLSPFGRRGRGIPQYHDDDEVSQIQHVKGFIINRQLPAFKYPEKKQHGCWEVWPQLGGPTWWGGLGPWWPKVQLQTRQFLLCWTQSSLWAC